VKTRILFKIGIKNEKFREMVEAVAILSRTDQSQLEIIPIRRNYWNSVTL